MRRIRVSKLRRAATVACTALATLLVTTAPAGAVPAESGGGGVVTGNPVEIRPVGDVITIDLRLAVTMLIVAVACAALAAIALTRRRQSRAG